jgi:Holliday junction DNA helicase RuvA
MIHHLRGRLRGGGKEFVVLECAGIGFRVHVSAATRGDLPSDGEECLLRTYLYMREGGGDLFGFSSETEREVFLSLLGVSGVGPKSALAVLSVLGINGVLAGAARGDTVAFTRVSGIGKKLAQRIAMELPDRLKKISVELSPGEGAAKGIPALPETEAVEALVSLGFPRSDAQVVVSRVRKELGAEEPGSERLVREALKQLGARS